MPLRERHAGSGFQIPFERDGTHLIGELHDDVDLPRIAGSSVRATSGIVRGKTGADAAARRPRSERVGSDEGKGPARRDPGAQHPLQQRAGGAERALAVGRCGGREACRYGDERSAGHP